MISTHAHIVAADFISDALTSALSDVWGKVVYYATFSFLDPFWGWLCLGLMVIATVTVVAWFFGSLFPMLRAIAGVVVLIVTFGLVAYRKGEQDARAHDRPKTKPKPSPKNSGKGWNPFG